MNQPLATYRVQLRKEFGFDAAASIAAYLAELGVSHLYTSPCFQAQPGSTHGYDVLDHARPSDDLGGAGAHAHLCDTLARHGLRQIIDIVPNHMSVASPLNRWWWDVLENGVSSRYSNYFDVDWRPPEERLRNNVVLPILGDHVGRVLAKGEIQLARDGATFTLRYYDQAFPVAPYSLTPVLSYAARKAKSDELAFLADVYERLTPVDRRDRKGLGIRHRDKQVLRRLLERLCREDERVATALDEVVARVNSDAEWLGQLLDQQNYRLAFWRTAGEELVYRRFFDINTLASLRMEDEEVFEDTHELALEWMARGQVDGLRIDHPDGLRDPEQYFERLRARAPEAWIVVEKILQPGEDLPATWPVQGTTGYDYLNQLAGVLIDPAGEEPLTRFYQEFTGETRTFEECVYDGKQRVLRDAFAADIHRLTELLIQICERHPYYRDYTRRDLYAALHEIMACYPVYRTYTRAGETSVSEADIRAIDHAIGVAREKAPALEEQLFHFLRQLLLLQLPGELEHEFAMRFQQATGAAVAKGVEDTAFYNYNRFVALNEVGGDPGQFGYSLAHFHEYCQRMQERWPLTMLATTTHDTKRSEDVRARLYVLSEIPEQWIAAVRRWSDMNARHKTGGAPEANFEYALYQALVGAWPITPERAIVYARKAAREAKAQTSWVAPNETYEQSVTTFIERILADDAFVRDLTGFVETIKLPGWLTSLAQGLIKLTSPGVPDIYQGNEVWDYSLVDPDNRRLVDYEHRRRLLGEMNDLSLAQTMQRMPEGLPKLRLTQRVLRARKRRPKLFGPAGSYEPIWASGVHRDSVLAYRRGEDAIVVAPLRLTRTWGRWENTALTLPPGRWKNEVTDEVFEGGEIRLGALCQNFPGALLLREA